MTRLMFFPCLHDVWEVINRDAGYVYGSFLPDDLLARLDEVQEELLYYPGVGGGVSKKLKFMSKSFV